jgi:hypothetical protein
MGVAAGKIVLHERNTVIHLIIIQIFIFSVEISSLEEMHPDNKD